MSRFIPGLLHYYKILFCEALKKGLGGGQFRKPPRLMPAINRGGHFQLTEVVTTNRLAKYINQGGRHKPTASVNQAQPDSPRSPITRTSIYTGLRFPTHPLPPPLSRPSLSQ